MATLSHRPNDGFPIPATWRGLAFGVAAGALLLGFGGSEARAQNVPGFALDRFEPSGGGSDWFTLESLDLRGRVRPAIGLTGNWAWKPLIIYNPDATENTVLVRHQVFAHLGAALNLWGRARVGLNVPVALHQSGDGGTLGGRSYAGAGEAAMGDVRATVDVRLLGMSGDRLTMAAGWQVFFPTGNQQQYAGDAGFRVAPRLLLAGDVGGVAYAVRLGYRYRVAQPSAGGSPGAFQGVGASSEVTGGAGLGFRFAPTVLVGLELSATTVAGDGHFFDRRSTPMELLAGAHFTVRRDWRVGAGVVPGLTDGIGAPAVRGVVQIEFFPALAAATPRVTPVPEAPPPPVSFAEPAAPPPPVPAAVPPVPAPSDKDQDGIADGEDACPELPGIKTDDPKTSGCPAPTDKDDDKITDAEDACPDHAGPRDLDPKKNGCPVVRIESGQVRIVEQVKFKTNSAVILKQSDYVLAAVVSLLAGHTEITKMRIEGHTDDRGKLKRNQKLSERRAASILKWLVKHGVDKRRLTSVGFGAAKPIGTNQTDEGRRENRRVEFHIAAGASTSNVP